MKTPKKSVVSCTMFNYYKFGKIIQWLLGYEAWKVREPLLVLSSASKFLEWLFSD